MTTLSYVPVGTSPRYGRLALGGGLLTGAFLIAAVSYRAREWIAPTKLMQPYFRLGFDAATSVLILAAAPLLATFRRNSSRRWVVFFTTLAALHLALNAAYSGVWFPAVLYRGTLTFSLLETGYRLDPLFCLALLLGALVLVARLRIPPLTILAILGLAPEFVWQVYALAFWVLQRFAHIEWRAPRAFVTWYIDYRNFPLILFWLTLTILALVLAVKSPRTATP